MLTALVPARKEIKKVKDKNILPFGKSTLLEHKLEQLKKVPSIDNIIVSTDDKNIAQIAVNSGVKVFMRPGKYASPDCPFSAFVEYICSELPGNDILWSCVTAPFIDETDYENAIALYRQILHEGYDSLITVTKLNRHILDINGAVNFQRGIRHKNSEDLNGLLLFTNGIVIAPREKMIAWKYHWGHIPYMVEVTPKKGIDIIDYYDYEVACALYEKDN
ncbi:MAG TPA: acylneuraminate cytidylyltransferase [Lachnospiraceae bacterium]|nr:acylneuraminate cytidylyltransferase [Lachnospiraceae bacterium]